MKRKLRTTHKISKEKAVEIAANHNWVSIEVASRYTDSELREVLKHLNLMPNF